MWLLGVEWVVYTDLICNLDTHSSSKTDTPQSNNKPTTGSKHQKVFIQDEVSKDQLRGSTPNFQSSKVSDVKTKNADLEDELLSDSEDSPCTDVEINLERNGGKSKTKT